jgi:phospholipase/carboxylesterase
MPEPDSELLPCVEVAPRAPVRASVVWLHGLGADGHDFEPLVPALGRAAEGVRFVFPHAPEIPVTINGGWVMPAWYDIRDADFDRRADGAGLQRSADAVTALVRRENDRGVPSARIVLAGFSQGGAVALHLALRHPERLAGVIALSTYLVSGSRLASERADANRDLPIFQAHGTFDPMVPLERGEAARDLLTELGHEVAWHAYPMQHQVVPEEIADLAAWLATALPA